MTEKYPTSELNNEEAEVLVMIRQAEESDAKAILGLSQLVGSETDYLTFGPEGSPLTVEQEAQLITMYRDNPNALMLVGEVDDQIVAMANLSPLDSHRQFHVAEIGISVIEEYWGNKLGSFLLEELLDYAQASQLRVITLEVVTENTRAIRLYEKFGFQRVGHLSKRLYVNYRYYDTLLMELVL